MPLTDIKSDSPADAEITGPYLPTAAQRGMRNYAFFLAPGEYAMTRISLRVTQSMTQVGHIEMGPEQLNPNGTVKAGSFRKRRKGSGLDYCLQKIVDVRL
jgi:hypothetical protein